MRTIILNDLHTVFKRKLFALALVVLASIGFFVGLRFNISIGEGVAVNAPYSISFMIGLLSLSIIFIATILSFVLLFKEKDANISLIIFSTPVKKTDFALARFSSFFLLTLSCFFILILGYIIGLHIQTQLVSNPGFHLWYFIHPFILFGVANALFVGSILFFVAQKFQNKLTVAVSGLLLYVVYMIVLVFSNAPFMAQALPQSLFAQHVSALVDPFGLSGYFFVGRNLTVLQRNSQVVTLSWSWLENRLFFITLSLGMITAGIRSFSFLPIFRKSKKQDATPSNIRSKNIPIGGAATQFNYKTKWRAIFSYFKVDSIYLFKSIALVTVSILLLFYAGMEMYADIEKGIRVPQYYASSGLLAQTINNFFFYIGAMIVVYFVNDIYWRSKTAGFSVIQDTTNYAKERITGHLESITLLVFYATVLLLVEGIFFQLIFKYPHVDWSAYGGVVVFNTFPLILFSLILLLINDISTNKNLALGISIILFLVFATPVSKGIISNPLFRFLSGFKGPYSDFLGYGSYLPLFLWRLAFGFSVVLFLFLMYLFFKNHEKRIPKLIGLLACIILAIVGGTQFLTGYTGNDTDALLNKRVHYERTFRKYQKIPQPAIKKVTARIDLFPNKQAYQINGQYVIKNTHGQPIDSLLLNVPKNFNIKSLTYHYNGKSRTIQAPVSELILKKAIQPQDSATLDFKLYYKRHVINGDQPFNAIIKNGSFMRISRYFPQFGYDADREISDAKIRKKYNLGKATTIKKLDAPRDDVDDFIDLDMQISTSKDQIAVGTGELSRKWQKNGRNYYTYKAKAIPFRFALSSAKYQLKKVMHHGVQIKVYYDALHHQNVDALIKNAEVALDYCITNFGSYPFNSVIFAEVSSFTRGFAGTAYPGVIFMTEGTIFNANITSNDDKYFINDLAGHEVSHFWWGNSQIDPDFREGYAMLTESLAMYTEMMICKKLYGKEKMRKQLKINEQIYNAEKGFNKNIPLIKVTNQVYLAYSRGAIVFVKISELIGEDQLNLALKHFLHKYKYPNPKPISTDLLHEILKVSNQKYRQKIKALFGVKS